MIRYAVVGLGYISQIAMLPAFAGARRNSRLAALVSGDPAKLQRLGRQYRVPHLVGYDDLDGLLSSGEIDAIYLGLPNTLHREYAERAARRGVHVLCDKPLAMTAADCRAMIDAAAQGGAKLMTAYRLHFEPANLAVLKLLRDGAIGAPRIVTSQFTQQVRPGNIRTRASLGGGPLYDMGIYCLNAARHVFEAEPEEVVATAVRSEDERFAEIDETVQAVLRFPGERLASFTCSFGVTDVSTFQVEGTKGNLSLDQAYEMAGEKTVRISPAKGRPRERSFPAVDQFAPLLLHFSDCIREDRQPIPTGKEGLADIRALEAIARSLETHAPVRLDPTAFLGPRLAGERPSRMAAHDPPRLFRAQKPSL